MGFFSKKKNKVNELNETMLALYNKASDKDKKLLFDNDYRNVLDLFILDTDIYNKMLRPIQEMMDSGKPYSSFDHPYTKEEIKRFIEGAKNKLKSKVMKQHLTVIDMYIDGDI